MMPTLITSSPAACTPLASTPAVTAAAALALRKSRRLLSCRVVTLRLLGYETWQRELEHSMPGGGSMGNGEWPVGSEKAGERAVSSAFPSPVPHPPVFTHSFLLSRVTVER